MNALLMPPIIGLDENTREYGFNASYRNNVNPYERLMSVVDKREKKPSIPLCGRKQKS